MIESQTANLVDAFSRPPKPTSCPSVGPFGIRTMGTPLQHTLHLQTPQRQTPVVSMARQTQIFNT